MSKTIPSLGLGAKPYLRPVQFVDTPVGLDGRVDRLAGGMSWFAAYELILAEDGARVFEDHVPVEAIDDTIAALPQRVGEAAVAIRERIAAPRAPLQLGERTIRFDQAQVAGILNLTPDSFSDAGKHGEDAVAASDAAVAMAAEGAALVDIGGESTRPGAATVWARDEIARVVPVIERLSLSGTAISIDTRKAEVMEAALVAGAHMVNDVAALLWDERAVEVVAAAGCPVVLMHSPDPKKEPHAEHRYRDALIEVYDWLEARVEAVAARGVAREKIVIDPGIGFGKSVQVNLQLLNGLAMFQGLGCPVMLGASRKRMIGALAGEVPADQRLAGSIALALAGAQQGAQILRVHDVAETVQALRIWRGLRDAAMMPRDLG